LALHRLTPIALLLTVWGCSGDLGESKGVDDAAAIAPGSADAAVAPLETGEQAERCNQFDDDGDGEVDEGCPCTAGQSQHCVPLAEQVWTQLSSEAGGEPAGLCRMGTQACAGGDDEFLTWDRCTDYVLPAEEICGDGLDQDCNGSDLPCAPSLPPHDKAVPFAFAGDCVIPECPAEAPHVVGCNVTYDGGDGRACVAHREHDSKVYFQEGNDCCHGSVSGTLYCSATPGAPLDASNCQIKTTKASGFTGVTYAGGCGGCVKAHCDGKPYTCTYP
jgi:hypothetical protein